MSVCPTSTSSQGRATEYEYSLLGSLEIQIYLKTYLDLHYRFYLQKIMMFENVAY
jgi:hypothetical protein